MYLHVTKLRNSITNYIFNSPNLVLMLCCYGLTTNIDYSTTAMLENVFVIYDCETKSAICM